MRPRPAKITVRFDQQQRKLLDFLRTEKKFGTDDGEIIRNVVLDYIKQQSKRGKRRESARNPASRRFETTLQPVSGKAVEVHKGEVLRITQVESGQCVDFNCFNLDDHKEYMSVGHMRREAFHPIAGQFIWSNPPRYRPMMKILFDAADLRRRFARGALLRRPSSKATSGIDDHPTCQDTLAEAIGEYGLTPDDVHDSLNLWMNTEVDHIGYYTVWNTAKAGRLHRPCSP